MSDIESDSHRNVTRVTAQCSRCDKPRDIVEATTAFLNRNGPATLTEIHGELKARGVEIGNGNDEKQRGYLSSMIYKSRAFKQVSGRRWAPIATQPSQEGTGASRAPVGH